MNTMPRTAENSGVAAVNPGETRHAATDPYARHILWLINSNMFPEAQASLREELLEYIFGLATEEETFNAYWA